jgi:NADPH:quinone reductase-like Zn-dependent oxidoreductase
MALGVEASGVVAGVGSDDVGFAIGDEVLLHAVPFRDQGAWAEKLIAPAATVARKPPGVAWEVAAAFPVPALTADQVLTDALAVQSGETLLVHGAGGVTGGLVVQLAVASGLAVVATAGPASAERVRSFGAVAVLDYRDPAWPADARRRGGGEGVTSAVNAVPGGAATALTVMADHGRLATITGDPPPPERGIIISDVYVRPDGAQLAALAVLLSEGLLSVNASREFPVQDAGLALQGVGSGASAGATTLKLSEK